LLYLYCTVQHCFEKEGFLPEFLVDLTEENEKLFERPAGPQCNHATY
jgi:hypothetical protein